MKGYDKGIMRGLAAAIALAGLGWAQEAGQDSVIRITTSLVQIDAIVTDRDGKLVTNLEAQDFEILQDGKKRDITAFSLVETIPSRREQQAREGDRGKAAAPPELPVQGVAREGVRRTIAIVVDDLNIQFADLARVRQAVTRFVTEDLQPGDLCAIVTTQGGMGVYSQFTADRALLAEAASKLVWSKQQEPEPGSIPGVVSEEVRALRAGSFGALLGGIQAMRGMPGRKSIVLFSAGVVSADPGDRTLQAIADEATRAGVTIYPIRVFDAAAVRLPPFPDFGGMNSKSRDTPRRIDEARRAAELALALALGDMSYLARQTGGLYFQNDNGLRELLVRVLNDQNAFYLLGYNPGQDSFDRKFHNIQVRVLRSGLIVRSRTGYMGVEERPDRRVLETSARRLVRSLLGPFQENDIHTRLTATFRSDGNKPRVLSQLWIDGKDLKFEPREDGKFHTELEVIVANFDPQGYMREHTERGYRLHLTAEQLAEVRRSGVLYSISYAAKRPGANHVRMAVREKSTLHVGTASQFLITPDLGKGRLALSGMIVTGLEDDKKNDDVSKPWMSLLRLGRGIEWEAQVYHARLKKGMPNLKAYLRLYREGELLEEIEPIAVEVKEPLKKKQIDVPVRGSALLNESFAPGEYLLQLIVTDENDKSKTVTQAIAFQVVQ